MKKFFRGLRQELFFPRGAADIAALFFPVPSVGKKPERRPRIFPHAPSKREKMSMVPASSSPASSPRATATDTRSTSPPPPPSPPPPSSTSRYSCVRTLRRTLLGSVVIAVDNRTRQQVAIKCSRNADAPRVCRRRSFFFLQPWPPLPLLAHVRSLCVCARACVRVCVRFVCTRARAVQLDWAGEQLLESPSEEVRIMRRLASDGGHPHLLRLLDWRSASRSVSGESLTVLELCPNGELFEHIAEHGPLSEQRCAEYMRQLVSAVKFCHDRGIVHLDLSLENTLLDARNNLRISDFGMARELERVAPLVLAPLPQPQPPFLSSTPLPSPPSTPASSPLSSPRSQSPSPSSPVFSSERSSSPPPSSSLQSLVLPTVAPGPVTSGIPQQQQQQQQQQPCLWTSSVAAAPMRGRPGKIGYMAPEVYRGLEFDGRLADTFSLGVMLFLMLTGIPPWKRPCESDTRFRMIANGELDKLLVAWDCRVSSSARHLLSRLLCWRPTRYTIEQVAAHPFVALIDTNDIAAAATATVTAAANSGGDNASMHLVAALNTRPSPNRLSSPVPLQPSPTSSSPSPSPSPSSPSSPSTDSLPAPRFGRESLSPPSPTPSSSSSPPSTDSLLAPRSDRESSSSPPSTLSSPPWSRAPHPEHLGIFDAGDFSTQGAHRV